MIYAISDTHGDLKRTIELMRQYNIIDENDDWIAGKSILVVNGDTTDRGKKGIPLLILWMKLSKQAVAAGGRLIHTIGNHDGMILSIALDLLNDDYDPNHLDIFRMNGGRMTDAKAISLRSGIIKFIQSAPLMVKIDDVLFQHADGFKFYEQAIKNQTQGEDENMTPEQLIKAVNAYGANKLRTARGAWQIFYDLTDERFWNGNIDHLPEYLKRFDAKLVVHGHTGHPAPYPVYYAMNKAVNIDAILSNGYRKDADRGCILEIDSPGENIIM